MPENQCERNFMKQCVPCNMRITTATKNDWCQLGVHPSKTEGHGKICLPQVRPRSFSLVASSSARAFTLRKLKVMIPRLAIIWHRGQLGVVPNNRQMLTPILIIGLGEIGSQVYAP